MNDQTHIDSFLIPPQVILSDTNNRTDNDTNIRSDNQSTISHQETELNEPSDRQMAVSNLQSTSDIVDISLSDQIRHTTHSELTSTDANRQSSNDKLKDTSKYDSSDSSIIKDTCDQHIAHSSLNFSLNPPVITNFYQ